MANMLVRRSGWPTRHRGGAEEFRKMQYMKQDYSLYVRLSGKKHVETNYMESANQEMRIFFKIMDTT